MIVKCEQCQTRFKIPDEKVTDRGVKVRCTKCQHTFRVFREPQAGATAPVPAFAPPPPLSAAPADPFAAFGHSTPGLDEATRPGVVRPNLAAMMAPQPMGGFEEEEAVTRVAPLPKNLDGMMRPPSGPLGLASPRAPAPAAPSSDPFAFALGSAPLPATRPQPAFTGDPFAAAAAHDPFATFGSTAPVASPVTVTQPAMAAPPPLADSSAWTQPHAAYPPPQVGYEPPPPPVQSWEAKTFTGTLPSTQQNPAFQPPPAAPPQPGQPWDFAAPAPEPTQSQPAAYDFSAPAPEQTQSQPAPYDFSAPPPSQDAAPAPAWNAPETGGADPFASPGGSSPAAPFEDPGFEAPAPAAPPTADELPSFDAQGFGGDLSAPPAEQSSAMSGGPADASSLFGAPGTGLSADAPPEAPAVEDFPPPAPSQAAKTTEELAAEAARQIAEAEAGLPAGGRAEAMPEAPPPPRGSLASLVANASIAGVLLVVLLGLGTVYYNEGKLDLSALSVSRFKEYFSTQRDFVTVDLSNGLYDTRAGHPVFFVRGGVINKSGKDTRVKVRAEIFDGEQLVRHAEGWAGAVPSLEELHAIGAPGDVEALNERLSSSAKPVAEGGTGQFLVPFYEYPADLKGIRVKVVVTGGESDKAAAR